MADALDSPDIARHSFGVARRGYEQQEVRAFLHEVSSLVDRLHREASQLRERAERAEARIGISDDPDDTMLLEILGEETTRVLTSARDAASAIRTKAEAAAERIVADATLEAAEARADAIRGADLKVAEATAQSEALIAEARAELDRRRSEAEEAATMIRDEAATEAQAARDEAQRDVERIHAEGEAELESARLQGREMVAEAQAVRERVLRDLAVRRKRARQQVEKLNAGRERLLEAYDLVRRTIDQATDELSTSLSDARTAADAAARRVEEEPEPTLEELEEEVAAAGIQIDLSVAELDDVEADAPGPFSGEVPVVESAPEESGSEAAASAQPEPAVEPEERRGRRRRRKESFEGLPTSEMARVQPPADGEGIRILGGPATEPEGAPEAPVAEAGPAAAPAGEDGEAPGVDELFARLRADQGDDEASGAEASDAVESDEPGADSDEPDAAEPPAEATPFSERDAALEPVDKELARRLKRALADEQNEVLDLLRRQKPKGVDDVLPDPDDHAGRWAEVVVSALEEGSAAGAAWAGGDAGSIAGVADELARSLTAPLRERIDRSFAASDGNLDDVADRVRALYREWKGKRLTDTSRHFAAAAYARGVFDALPADAVVQWKVDPLGGPCPDCDDNVLAGTLTKGSEFPTGHRSAPAHPGCRCLVVAAGD